MLAFVIIDWQGTISLVRLSDCGDPSPINGSANLPRGTTYREIAYISCASGYVIQGNSEIICGDGPAWSSLPTCLKGINI